MDVLKRELQRKRQLLDSDFGGRKLLRRSEIERREIQRLREAERQQLLQKLHHKPTNLSTSFSSSVTPAEAAETMESHLQDVLPKEEVIRRLRLLRQPATLFGEDDNARLCRLHAILEDPTAIADIDADEIGEGQTNDFLSDIQALKAAAKAKPKPSGVERKEEEEVKKVEFEEMCDEEKILVFFRRLMNEWNQEVDEIPEVERRTTKGKAAVATCKQCARYLEPLFKLCKKKHGYIYSDW